MTENGFGNLKKSETEVHKVTLFLIFFSRLLFFYFALSTIVGQLLI